MRLLDFIPPGMNGRISTEEVCTMTEGGQSTPAGTKTLGVALPDELHAQFTLVAGLKNLSLKDAVRQAVESWIDQARAELSTRAHEAMAEIERDAAARRDALQALFGTQSESPDTSGTSRRRGREQSS
jgi:hypothetical protein